MSNSPKILALAGSARKGSFNVRLLRIAADAVRRSGGDVTLVDLRDYPLPLYDGDLEADEGVPDKAVKLAQLMLDHDALLIASPEYNSSITPLLKNTIDWVSRPSKNIPGLAAFKGKVAALMSASPGALGGLRGLVHVRSILGNIGVIVFPIRWRSHRQKTRLTKRVSSGTKKTVPRLHPLRSLWSKPHES
jgi:chromate reductase, NAD(P)H dehydrogenase (quinone)